MLNTREVFSGLATQWRVPASLPYFQGHFPGNPIFPAVAIVDASLTLIRRQQRNENLALLGVASSKFMHPIRPEQTVQIELKELAPGEWEAHWKDAKKLLATLRLKVGEESPP